MSPVKQTALIIGATGQTGRHLLQNLLASPHYSHVAEYGRSLTPTDQIKVGASKLEQKAIDFENLKESGLSSGKWDVIFITLGTTKAIAGSAEAFEKIDRQYVLDAAKEAKDSDPTHLQRLIYCSSNGADPNSRFLYPRSKGLTEQGLASLGYDDVIVFRPGFLVGTERKDSRIAETIFTKITGVLSHISDSVEIKVATLGRAICAVGEVGSKNLPSFVQPTKVGTGKDSYIVIGNADAHKLAEVEYTNPSDQT